MQVGGGLLACAEALEKIMRRFGYSAVPSLKTTLDMPRRQHATHVGSGELGHCVT